MSPGQAKSEPTVVVLGGTVVDAHGSRPADVVIRGGQIVEVAPKLAKPRGALVLEASGCVVLPGLVDLHTHLRQPGREEAETIESGTRAAALGGYTAVVAMPNTEPAIDSAAVVRQVQDLAVSGSAEVAVSGAITVGRAGERLAPMAEMAALGVRLFTDDGTGVQDGALMRRAMDYARGLGVTLAQHCEDAALSTGVMHEGAWSSRLGLPGTPAAAEEAMVARDLALARATGARLHLLHLSTEGSVELVARAKAQGLAVTAEATPHHLSLTDAAVANFDPLFKVNPPLRAERDVAAVRRALAQGTIDAVATDHAPHTPESKELAFIDAPPGMLGLQTALSVTVEAMGGQGEDTMDLCGVAAAMSWVPAAIAGLRERQGGPVAPGRPGNLCVFDPAATWMVEAGRLASRSTNTPYGGRRLTGKVRHTVAAGWPVVIDGEAQR